MQGMSLEDARRLGWLFPEAKQNAFWAQWGHLYALNSVHWEALPACFPTWLVVRSHLRSPARRHLSRVSPASR